jgi:glycosyltransferase involved in cell wall biosynthesis
VSAEVVVIANACTDRTIGVGRNSRERLPMTLRVVEEPNPGLGPARNRALKEAQGHLIAFLDDDVWVEREWLVGLAEASTLPFQIFAGRVTLEWESRPAWVSPDVERLLSVNDLGREARRLHSASALVGANFAIRRAVIEQIGEFAPALGRRASDLLSGEETELVCRALAAGHQLFYVPEMAIRHWIPRERATLDHLQKLARGRGRTRVALMTRPRGMDVWRCLRLGVAQAVVGGTHALNGWFSRDDVKRVAGSLLCHRGLGALYGLCGKAMSVSPHGLAHGEAQK